MPKLPSPPRRPFARAILGLLAFAAVVHLGYQLAIGLEPSDVGPFETVLARAVAGHFDRDVGPSGFYGPFSGDNPSVLIHAPLYYRLVALAAWPFVRLGGDPLMTVLYAGRLLAFLGTLLLLTSAVGLARLDGASTRAGAIAAALVAASPILGNLAAMLRPDALGVGLQTFGAWLVLTSLRDDSRRSPRLGAAYAAFALAFGIKQQNLTAAVVSSMLLAHAWWRGRLRIGPIVAGHAAALAIVAADLIIENVLTSGRMYHSVFVYPGGPFRALNYAGWVHVASIFDITARRSVGLLALATACLWGLRGRGILPSFRRRPKAEGRWPIVRNGLLSNLDHPTIDHFSLDATLALFLAVELAALVPLCLFNAGAAYNYALQAIVFGCVLVARALDRLLGESSSLPSRLLPAAVAMVVLLLADMRLLVQDTHARAADRAILQAMFADADVARCPSSARYFVGRHHLNRLFGRTDLIHDDWLYGAFEQIGAAEPRESWLRDALADGPVRQVVVPGSGDAVPGVAEPLPDLGYRQIARFGDLAVWQRR